LDLTKRAKQLPFSRQDFDAGRGCADSKSNAVSGSDPQSMQDIGLRSATSGDAAFALYVTESCMRVYAEQIWGSWNGCANCDPALDNIIELEGQDIGLIGIRRCSDHWFLDKLYLLPRYQNRGFGGHLIER
jgi:GNAT superfamily N-acetyltransferase